MRMLYKSQVQSGIKSHNNIRGDNNSLKQPLCKIVLRYIHVLRTGIKISAHYDWKNEFLMSRKKRGLFHPSQIHAPYGTLHLRRVQTPNFS